MKIFQKAPLALAITALMAAPAAFADNGGGYTSSSDIESNFYNNIDVDLEYDSTATIDTDVKVWVRDNLNHFSGATVDSKQLIKNNGVYNLGSSNDASVGEDTLNGATGNIGVNVAAGDNNQQANDAALSSSDAARVFSQASAWSAQSTTNNEVANVGNDNNAGLEGNALNGASGNIAVNVAAGSMNAQQNSLTAASSTNAGSAQASTGGVQQTSGNYVKNLPEIREVAGDIAALDLQFEVDASGLKMDQIGDVYPDMWEGETHKGGDNIGHFDLDTETQGGSDLNNDGGALAFSATDDSVLSGTISGSVPTFTYEYTYQSNDATLGGNSLNGASGNIGVNVVAGTNNLQRNSLSIASAMAPPASAGNGGETPQ